jgi:signal transduction histidine kinase
VLRTVAEAVSLSLDLEEVLDRALRALTHVTGHEIASLHLVAADGQRLLLRGERGMSPALREANLVLPVGRGLIGTVAESGQACRIDDAAAAPGVLAQARPAVVADGIRAFVCVPIRARRRVLGTLSLGRQRGSRFSDQELFLLECVADQIGVALDNARLLGDTRRRIEDLDRARSAVVRGERLSAVTELAAGVAHEINNPLTVILAQVHVLLQGRPPEELRRALETVEQAARRAAGVVKDLTLFAQPRRAARRPCDLGELVRRAVEVYRERLAAEHIELDLELQEQAPLWADPDQIYQVLTALVDNARHAMRTAHGRGTLSIRLHGTHFGVWLEVADDGPGIAPEHLHRVFTPFFTTKGPDEGRGLGLSVAHGVVREHGGRLWAKNRPEGGTRFVLELPRSLRRDLPGETGPAVTPAAS